MKLHEMNKTKQPPKSQTITQISQRESKLPVTDMANQVFTVIGDDGYPHRVYFDRDGRLVPFADDYYAFY